MTDRNCDIHDFLLECSDEIACPPDRPDGAPLPLCPLDGQPHLCCAYALLRFIAGLGDHADDFLREVKRRYHG